MHPRLKVLRTDERRLRFDAHRGFKAIAQVFDKEHEKALVKAGYKKACKEGCNWCCTHDTPDVLDIEVGALLHAFETRPELSDIIDILHEQLLRITQLVREGVAESRLGEFPCPFLGSKSGACRIYDIRPLGCRCALSDDASECEQSAMDKSKNKWTPDNRILVPVFTRLLLHFDEPTRRAIESVLSASLSKRINLAFALGFNLFPGWHEVTKATKASYERQGKGTAGNRSG